MPPTHGLVLTMSSSGPVLTWPDGAPVRGVVRIALDADHVQGPPVVTIALIPVSRAPLGRQHQAGPHLVLGVFHEHGD